MTYQLRHPKPIDAMQFNYYVGGWDVITWVEGLMRGSASYSYLLNYLNTGDWVVIKHPEEPRVLTNDEFNDKYIFTEFTQ